jgi:hypothetical protein
MRPRRKILLWSQREEDAKLIAFALNTSLHVTTERCKTASSLILALRADLEGTDLIILADSGDHDLTEAVAKQAHGTALRVPILVLARLKEKSPLDVEAASLILPYGTSNADLFERVKVMTARKRGPRKANPPVAVAEVA